MQIQINKQKLNISMRKEPAGFIIIFISRMIFNFVFPFGINIDKISSYGERDRESTQINQKFVYIRKHI